MSTRIITAKANLSNAADNARRGTLVLHWDYDTCTGEMASAFARMSRCIENEGAGDVILDMSKCDYLSISGMNSLIEFYLNFARDDVKIRVRGLKPILKDLFKLTKLDWILTDG